MVNDKQNNNIIQIQSDCACIVKYYTNMQYNVCFIIKWDYPFFSHLTNLMPAFSHRCLVSFPPGSLALATDSVIGQQHTGALESSTFTITHQSLFHIISNHCWFICFNLCLILSWDAGEDSFNGYRLSWLTTSHLWIDNLTYYVPVLLYHDVVSE